MVSLKEQLDKLNADIKAVEDELLEKENEQRIKEEIVRKREVLRAMKFQKKYPKITQGIRTTTKVSKQVGSKLWSGAKKAGQVYATAQKNSVEWEKQQREAQAKRSKQKNKEKDLPALSLFG